MERPEESYVFKPYKYCKCTKKVAESFGRHLIQELISNPDGVQLPLGFIQLVCTKLAKYYKPRINGEDPVVIINYHSDYYLVHTYVDIKHRLARSKFWKFTAGQALRRAIYKSAHDGTWATFNKFRNLGELRRSYNETKDYYK